MSANDPLGLFENDDPLGLFEAGPTSFSEDNALAEAGVMNTYSKAKGLTLGGIATALGDKATADEIYRDMEETTKRRLKEANPEGKEQSFGGKAYGMLSTLPAQLVSMPLSPFDTGQELTEAGESGGVTQGGALIDAGFNALGVGLPGTVGKGLVKKALSGAAINAAQDAASRKAIATLAETKAAKEKFEPTRETTALAAILGAGLGALHGLGDRRGNAKAEADAAFQKKLDEAQEKPVPAPAEKDPLGLFENLKATEGEGGQMALWDIDESGRMPNPTEAVTGDWRIDENGIPIKADLSMDAANVERGTLQRNLWGDELAPKHEQEGVPLSAAIDKMPDAPWRTDRDVGIDMLKHEIEADGPMNRALMDAEVQTPRSTLTDPSIPKGTEGKPMFVKRGQRGAINPEVFKEGFEKLKQLADGSWLRAYNDGRELHIEVRKDGHLLGVTQFSAEYPLTKLREKGETGLSERGGNERNLEAGFTSVKSPYRGNGYAKEMYKFASELGNDIRASHIQTPDGTAMWNKFEKAGFARDGYVPKSQRGAIKFGDPKREQLEKILGREGTMIPENPDPKAVLKAALAEGKDGGSWKSHESGSTSAWMKRGSAAIQGVSRMLQNAEKAAELQIRNFVHPVEQSLRRLSSVDIQHLQKTMMAEMLGGERFPLAKLEALLNPQQLKAYAHMRKAFEDTLRIQNEARAIKGQKPITEQEAYLSSRWNGDFRRPLYEAVLNKDGSPKVNEKGEIQKKLVWYLAANTKRGLDAQTKQLLKDRPDLTYDVKDDHTVRYYKRQTDLQSAFSTILDILGRDDPAIARIQEAVKEQTVNEAATFLGQEKHFKEKAGVRGFVGDRPGADPAKEARAFFQQQIQYAKNAYKWSEIQKASEDVKEVVSNPDLIKAQPNNIAYLKDYYKNMIGYGEHRVMAHLEDSIRDLGISPSIIDKAVGGTKTFFILTKLSSLGYVAANAIQTTMVIPHLLDISKKHGISGTTLVTAMPIGLMGGMAMALSHYGKQAAIHFESPMLKGAMEYMESKWGDLKYAEDNGATARSIYDESPIESSFSIPGKVATSMGKLIAAPEVFVRSVAFMTFAHALKDSKILKSDLEAYQLAEEYTNKSMVDYRASERPMIFSKLGIVGNFLNTLQTYPINFYNQWNYFGREAVKGNVAPILAMFALQYALAGASGMPYANDLFKMHGFIKDHLPATYWQKAQESEFWSNPKLWMLDKFGDAAVYGALSDKTGIGMTSRVTAPGVGEMIQAPGGPAAELVKQGIAVGDAAFHPTNTTKRAQALHDIAPVGIQGLIETDPKMEGITYEGQRPDGRRPIMSTSDLSEHKAVYARTPEEMNIRKWGFRSQPETAERDIGYMTNRDNQASQKKAKDLVGQFYDAVKRGDKADAKELYTVYTKITGNGIPDEAINAQVNENYLTTVERAATAAKTVTALQNVKRMQSILKEIRQEAGK